MIKSFTNKETEKIWRGHFSRLLPIHIQNTARRKLRMINNSFDLLDLAIPLSNHLEKLKGARRFQFSIRINKQYRICFLWRNGDAFNVEIIDYH